MTTNDRRSSEGILADYAEESYGASVRATNITAAIAVAESVRSTLGPQGMDKMLVDKTYDITGDVVITNDGATVLDEMEVENDAATLAIELAQAQAENVGDGTTTAVLYVGQLLEEAGDLLERGIHPSTIAGGYRTAALQARSRLETLADELELEDPIAAVTTAMDGKSGGTDKEPLARLVVDAVDRIVEADGTLDTDNIKIISRTGKSVEDSQLVEGTILEKERVHENMPRSVSDATVALYDGEIRSRHENEEFTVTDPDAYHSIVERERESIKSRAAEFVDVGADVVFVRTFLDDYAQQVLADHGILAVRQVDLSDLELLSRATGAEIVGDLEALSASDLGYAGTVRQRELGGREMVQVTDVEDAKSVTLILRASTEHVLEEFERTIEDGMAVAELMKSDGRALPGAGATEIELARDIRSAATGVSGREQLAVEAFADAVETVPRTLAENAGLDRIDTIAELYAAHSDGEIESGVLGVEGRVGNAVEAGIIEPFAVKQRALDSAAEIATLILRVDGQIRTEPLTQAEEDELVDRVEAGEDREKAKRQVLKQRD